MALIRPFFILERFTFATPTFSDNSFRLIFRSAITRSKRTYIVKNCLDDEEHADFLRRLEIYDMNQSEFIREAISGATIKPTIVATLVSDDLLAAVGKLIAEYGRIGNNLNQIARHLNEWHSP